MLRNKEIRRFAALLAGLAALFTAAGFAIAPGAGLLVLAALASFGLAFALFTRRRYERLADLAEEIDRVLHNADRVVISEAEEGELAVLQSEITKMTLRIREQNDALKREKKNLADSLADVAHQLRTPLTSANLVLTLLEDEPEEPRRRQLLREAGQLFARMDWLLNSLLKLSRLDAGIVEFRCEAAPVEALITRALRPLLIPLELHGVTVQTDLAPGAVIRCDEAWMAEALGNILKNCQESAGEGGRICIACQDNPLYTELTIRDSGPGFAPEELPNLFDRFYRGKSSAAAGYGIGLALCKTIVTQQGGTVTAKNHPRGGAVFTLRFAK